MRSLQVIERVSESDFRSRRLTLLLMVLVMVLMPPTALVGAVWRLIGGSRQFQQPEGGVASDSRRRLVAGSVPAVTKF